MVPGAQPLADVVDGAQLVVPIGAGVAVWVVLVGKVGVVGVTPVAGTAVAVPVGEGVPGAGVAPGTAPDAPLVAGVPAVVPVPVLPVVCAPAASAERKVQAIAKHAIAKNAPACRLLCPTLICVLPNVCSLCAARATQGCFFGNVRLRQGLPALPPNAPTHAATKDGVRCALTKQNYSLGPGLLLGGGGFCWFWSVEVVGLPGAPGGPLAPGAVMYDVPGSFWFMGCCCC